MAFRALGWGGEGGAGRGVLGKVLDWEKRAFERQRGLLGALVICSRRAYPGTTMLWVGGLVLVRAGRYSIRNGGVNLIPHQYGICYGSGSRFIHVSVTADAASCAIEIETSDSLLASGQCCALPIGTTHPATSRS
ncbi:hypothetical protein P167DRAFT_548373 [Morchella conica CCBAS932]|uniref:Uncharacterized protein n=1 Tax=Morchella conica CCBAS932 TaxID=1392247 RepID=A0A3N4KTP8_9PEZI|nr:hypothetical protein P167DRAFT_548373 [Morchella conica CCBAS932]